MTFNDKNLETYINKIAGRKHLPPKNSLFQNYLKGKKVLITGAAGSIGSELCRQVAKLKLSNLIIFDQDETGIFNLAEELKSKFPRLSLISIIGDITDENKIEKVFKQLCPEIVFHAAAYKHVPLMEEYPEEAVKNNIFGTEIITRIAKKFAVEKFIFISTDKAINPVSVMGTTKRVGEIICGSLQQKQSTKFMSVRFGNVIGSRGSVVPIFLDQIKNGGPVKVTHPDMKRYFMSTSLACFLVLYVAMVGEGGKVFVLNMGDPVKVLDLARKMISMFGLKEKRNIKIIFTGSRKGEKINEEIVSEDEKELHKKNSWVFVTELPYLNKKILQKGLNDLKKSITREDGKFIKKNLKNLVKEYVPG
ncbi:MAG: polysaccharide biosynthesis protein [Parcubacteria group bacterium]|nr:polysaccharide biosynthesis protein [Parcubacteria group bacterium]